MAATVAGAICGPPTSDVTALVERVRSEGTDQTVCENLPGGALAIKNGVRLSRRPVPRRPMRRVERSGRFRPDRIIGSPARCVVCAAVGSTAAMCEKFVQWLDCSAPTACAGSPTAT
ncbi:hypothetical protein MDOR_07270 [Mycolicibacterium doricum]|uniref:Uncharacterized protein n=1 Tax=Mycolicibacterium doricum TaxID=126673 RepID=A0A7I7VSW4_9MYCO|nr:hypothetical protein MDOR_07270 [Mycolicibacterium doricum]